TIDFGQLEETVVNICRNRWAEGIFDIPRKEIRSQQIAVIAGDVPEIMEIPDFNDLEEAWGAKTIDEITNYYPEEDNILRTIAYKIVVEFMKPNVIFDRETTERRQQDAMAKVPRYRGIVMKNERIVDDNTRVTPEVLLKLKSYAYELDKRGRAEKGMGQLLSWVGRFLLVGVILSFFFTFLRTYRSSLFDDKHMLLLFGSMYILMVGISYLFVFTFDFSEYLIPITVAAMVLTVLFDGRIAVMAAVTLAILIAFIVGNKLDYVIISLFTSVAAIYAVRNLRARAQLFSAILYIVISGIIAVTALGILKRSEWTDMRYDYLYIIISGVLAPFLTYGLSALFEIIFDVTSDLTLLELSDFNHPLLKRLSREANGTFNHCVVVGNLAESCAVALGANPLLSRVGAYYHDIGKLTRPEYFIENQFRGQNKHDNLSPTLSARIIASHIKDGLKLAKEYRLPSVVTDFVPMHHGTSRIEYFYQKAVEQADGDISKVSDSNFRYPGPKPNTKETGILMICEAVEAAVRSIKNPDLHKIKAMVGKIINKRLKEGQLDDCPLTMRDLARMKGDVRGGDGLLPVLRGIYHLRIEYPGQKEPATAEVSL
ncbi:MAG: HD family phosphohydrolase, partial [Fidelibacterota bacterium]